MFLNKEMRRRRWAKRAVYIIQIAAIETATIGFLTLLYTVTR